MREHRIHKTTFPLPAQLRPQKNPNPNTCSPIPLLPCPTSSRPRPTLCSSRTLSLAGAIAVPPIRARHPFAPAPTDVTPHRGSCIHAFVVQVLPAKGYGRLPRASTKNTHESLRGRPGKRGGIKSCQCNGNLLAVNAQTHTRTTLHTLLLRSSSTQAVQRWKEVPAPHRYDFRRPTRLAFSRRVASAF
jgi:hypothetical protein